VEPYPLHTHLLSRALNAKLNTNIRESKHSREDCLHKPTAPPTAHHGTAVGERSKCLQAPLTP